MGWFQVLFFQILNSLNKIIRDAKKPIGFDTQASSFSAKIGDLISQNFTRFLGHARPLSSFAR
jgi:hypothetical protein